MPIIDVRPVVSPSQALPENTAQLLADSFSRQLNTQPGRVWVRLVEIPQDKYAENGEALENNELPVFVELLHADWPDQGARAQEAEALAKAVAATLERPLERIHIEYAPPGRGRVAFGGKLVV